ncbi:MAG: CheR family methyltransferase [Gammaproteobacteria bacterium]
MIEYHFRKPPVRLRPSSDFSIGTTAFFRNRPLYTTLLRELTKSQKRHYRILFHACSIGAEVYSFVIYYLLGKFDKTIDITCEATDINPAFLGMAKRAHYPKAILNGMHAKESSYFRSSDQEVYLAEEVTRHVSILSPSSFSEFKSTATYDIVFLLNALVYVPCQEQARTIDSIANYNTEWLILSAFHEDTIKTDLQRAGYQPFITNISSLSTMLGWTVASLCRSTNQNREYMLIGRYPSFPKSRTMSTNSAHFLESSDVNNFIVQALA